MMRVLRKGQKYISANLRHYVEDAGSWWNEQKINANHLMKGQGCHLA